MRPSFDLGSLSGGLLYVKGPVSGPIPSKSNQTNEHTNRNFGLKRTSLLQSGSYQVQQRRSNRQTDKLTHRSDVARRLFIVASVTYSIPIGQTKCTSTEGLNLGRIQPHTKKAKLVTDVKKMSKIHCLVERKCKLI